LIWTEMVNFAPGTLYAHGNAKRLLLIDIFHNSIILQELW